MTDEHNNILVATTNSSTSSSSSNNSGPSISIHQHLHQHHQPHHQHLNHSAAIDKHVDAVSASAATAKPLPSTTPPTKDSIIAEAAKILLKNGSTAAAAAAATLLTAAATFQLPAPRPPSRVAPPTTEHHATQHSPATYKQHNHHHQQQHHRNHTPPPAHSGGSSPGAVASGAIDVSARRHHPLPPRKFLNNGTSAAPAAAHTSAPTKPTMAATTTTPGAAQMRLGMSSPAAAHLGGGGGGTASGSSSGKAPPELGAGAIDYTFHAAAAAASASVFGGGGGGTNNHHKYPLQGGGGSGNCRSELGRHPMSDGGSGPGGRLQFFKDGKFILELARSKDGDGKGGWVSVPRKLFRTPSAATSSTVTPTLATTTAYPKNESSTSLSFSDDNSSLQSSPWQRDHCWKQAAPRRGISHEMALYYWRPRGAVALTSKGLQVAHRKRRRPLDPPPNGEQRHFVSRHSKAAVPEPEQKEVKEERPLPETSPKGEDDKNGVKEEAKETAAACSPLDGGGEPTEKDNGPEPEAAAAETHKMDISGEEELLATGAECAPKSPATKDETTDNKEQRQEDEKTEEEPKKASEPKPEQPNEKPSTPEPEKSPKSNSQPTSKEDEAVEKMNTSEDDVDVSAAGEGDDAAGTSKAVNGHEPEGQKADEAGLSVIKSERPSTPAAKPEESLPISEESVAHTNGTPPGDSAPKPVVAKPLKSRAKLNTIIQKLIDSMPAKVAAPPKVPSASSAAPAAANNASAHHHNSNNNNKVSPTAPASATSAAGNPPASRLVDYHQQHVSPRKRILRDLEKVSLEDSGSCGSAAGGKRSRAKGNSVAVPIPTTASSPRGHAALSSTAATSGAMANGGGHASYQPPHYSNNKMLYQPANAPEASPKAGKSAVATSTTATTTTVAAASAAAATATPTRRLYSSYSIHSLLGGGSGSSSSASTNSSSASGSSSPANSKRPGSDQAVVSSSSSAYAQQQQQQYPDPSYLRHMLASPKSPEASAHAGHGSGYGGKSPSSSASRRQRSPPYPPSPMHEGSSRSPAASHAEFGRRSPRATPPDAGHKQPQQQQLLQAANANSQLSGLGPQHAAFYSQYMMASAKYPPAGGSSPASVARSPSHGPASSAGYGAANAAQHPPPPTHPHQQHQHIPNAAAAATGGLYGSGKAAGGSLSPPRSMSASPRDSTPRTVPKKTASIRRQFASPTASSTTSSSCPSPSSEAQRMAHADEAQQHERKAATHSAMQRSSPLGGGGGVSPMLHPHYYMYPPNNAAAAAAAAHAAAGQAAAYIPSVMSSVGGLPQAQPSYYNPYISTIAALQRNPMWMQYPGGGVLPVMSPHPSAGSRLATPFHGFPYNMAAAFGGGAPPPPHGMMHPGHAAAMSFYEGAGPSERPRSPPKPTESADLSMTAKVSMGGGAPSTSRSAASQSTPTANNCIKDEQSSDVPLNLSKH